MKLSAFKKHLKNLDEIKIVLPNGDLVPAHFHVTEVGHVQKHFIDCGGKLRTEEKVNFQLWEANDYDHRLHPEKLVHIIELSEEKLNIPDKQIEVEYQGETIGKYGLEVKGNTFHLTTTNTACLALDACGIPFEKLKKPLASLVAQKEACCSPESGCC
jgi:hypothetical protein